MPEPPVVVRGSGDAVLEEDGASIVLVVPLEDQRRVGERCRASQWGMSLLLTWIFRLNKARAPAMRCAPLFVTGSQFQERIPQCGLKDLKPQFRNHRSPQGLARSSARWDVTHSAPLGRRSFMPAPSGLLGWATGEKISGFSRFLILIKYEKQK